MEGDSPTLSYTSCLTSTITKQWSGNENISSSELYPSKKGHSIRADVEEDPGWGDFVLFWIKNDLKCGKWVQGKNALSKLYRSL